MKTNIVLAALVISLAQMVFAETVILGEYTGSGQLSVSASGSTGNSSYVNSCKMAYNLTFDNQELRIDFGVVECARGLDFWNDSPVALTILNGQLLNNGVQVGLIGADGTAVFTISNFKTKAFQVPVYDHQCKAFSFETRKFNVGSDLTYRLKKLSDNSYEMTREEQAFEVAHIMKKDWVNCPSHVDYVASSKQVNFSVNLTK